MATYTVVQKHVNYALHNFLLYFPMLGRLDHSFIQFSSIQFNSVQQFPHEQALGHSGEEKLKAQFCCPSDNWQFLIVERTLARLHIVHNVVHCSPLQHCVF